jgi:hypothetical protein
MKEAVALIFFNRTLVFQVIDEIRKYGPNKLFLIADGGRNNEEKKKCEKLRLEVEAKIDWQCEIVKVYSDINLGCRKNIPGGINRIFQMVDRVIVLEDDCVPSQDFFRFCEEMLDYYQNKEEIFVIVGTNYLGCKNFDKKADYYFSGFAETLGWATWKNRWEKYDADLKQWPQWSKENVILKSFLSSDLKKSFQDIFQQVYDKTINCDPWDYQWLCMQLANKGLSIVPSANLVTNIGYGHEATHTTSSNHPLANTPYGKLSFPLRHPPIIKRNEKFDNAYGKLVFSQGFIFLHFLRTIKRLVKEVIRNTPPH